MDALPDYGAAVSRVAQIVAARTRCTCIAINPEKIRQARADVRLYRFIYDANLRICDGVGVSLAVRLLYGQSVRRCTGVGLFFELIEAAAAHGWRVFLLGATEEVNQRAGQRLQARFPALCIAGRQNGFFDDEAEVVRRINAAKADLLFVALGSPRQEAWLAKHAAGLDVPFRMGVGGTFDVASGHVRWAPSLFRRTGTEFLYRLCCQPTRARRQVQLIRFTAQILRQWFRGPGVAGRDCAAVDSQIAAPTRKTWGRVRSIR